MNEQQNPSQKALAPADVVYLTGDTHGQFDQIVTFCALHNMEKENTLIILGDAGLNY